MNLINFNYNNNIVRTQVTDDGEPLFCLVDVCKVLELNGTENTVRQLKEEFGCPVLNTGHLVDSLGRNQEAIFITEPQLYFVMMRSRSDKAKPFRQWVVNEVLPSIRKTGRYEAPKTLKEPDLKVKFELAKMMLEPAGIEGNQLTLALDKLYRTNTGESLLAQTAVQLKAPTNDQLFTPTQLGAQLGISGAKVNILLEQLGFQTKVDKLWELTREGKKQGGTYLDVNKQHSNGTPVRQLKWPMSVLGSIKQFIDN